MVVPFIVPCRSFHMGWIPNEQWDIDRRQLDMEVATGTESAHCGLLLVSLELEYCGNFGCTLCQCS